MNTLFPKDTADLDFSSNDFLKVGDYALPFSDNKNTLDSKHTVY
jgi:hypothetical protein